LRDFRRRLVGPFAAIINRAAVRTEHERRERWSVGGCDAAGKRIGVEWRERFVEFGGHPHAHQQSLCAPLRQPRIQK
jgi:hypothetical protein